MDIEGKGISEKFLATMKIIEIIVVIFVETEVVLEKKSRYKFLFLV